MKRYYSGNDAKLASKERGGTSNGKRPKPLHGAKKYARQNLACTSPECSNKAESPDSLARNFFISYATTPAKRVCEECWRNPPKPTGKRAQTRELLKLCGIG